MGRDRLLKFRNTAGIRESASSSSHFFFFTKCLDSWILKGGNRVFSTR